MQSRQAEDATLRLINLNEQKSAAILQLSMILSTLSTRLGAWASNTTDENVKKEIEAFQQEIIRIIHPQEVKKDGSRKSTN